jgi:hypothetical protein
LQRTRRFDGAARAAAALIGIRIAAGRSGPAALTNSEILPPDWLYELDEHEADEELSLALYSPLDELMQARLAPQGRFAEPPAYTTRPLARHDSSRRGTCIQTRP